MEGNIEKYIEEINKLKLCVIQQNEEIKEYKEQLKIYKDNSVPKEELIKCENISKDLNKQLEETRIILNGLDKKNKENSSLSNSEKSILNNKIIELKNELNLLKEDKDNESKIKNEFIRKYEESLEKVNYLSSLNFQKERIIESLKDNQN